MKLCAKFEVSETRGIDCSDGKVVSWILVVERRCSVSLTCIHIICFYSISQEICTRFLLFCALLWFYIDFPISIRLTSLALWQSNDCPSASKATLMNMDKYFMWIHYERLHNHNKAKHNKTVCIFLGIYCMSCRPWYKGGKRKHRQLGRPSMSRFYYD